MNKDMFKFEFKSFTTYISNKVIQIRLITLVLSVSKDTDIVLQDITIISMEDPDAIYLSSVRINDGIITMIADSDNITYSKDATIYNCSGKF